jgi:hypothetical protein
MVYWRPTVKVPQAVARQTNFSVAEAKEIATGFGLPDSGHDLVQGLSKRAVKRVHDSKGALALP